MSDSISCSRPWPDRLGGALARLPILLARNSALTAAISVTIAIVPLVVLRACLLLAMYGAEYAGWQALAGHLGTLHALVFALLPLLVNVYLSLYLASRDRRSPVQGIAAGVCVLLGWQLVLYPGFFGLPDNLPVAMLSAFLAACLLRRTERWQVLDAGSNHGLVEQCVNQMVTLVMVAVAGGVLAWLSAPLLFGVADGISRWSASLAPTGFVDGLLYELVRGVCWLFGVNGHHVLRETSEALIAASAQNMAAWRAGSAPLNIVSNTFFDVWCAAGGAGGTLSLALLMLWRARDRGYRRLARASLPLSLLNVNEPLVFGVPIFFNPVLALPFLLAPLTGFVLAYAATLYGWVPPLQQQVGWMVPPLLNAWLASGGAWQAVLLQGVIIVLGVCLYAPFFTAFELRGLGTSRVLAALPGFEKADDGAGLTDRRHEYVAQMHERFRAEQNVARLQRDGRFELAFQPQVSLADGRVRGAEALLRHRGADGSLRGPTFIADYQALGLMPELDFMVLGEAVDAARQLGGHGAFTLSVNLSPQTVVDARLDGVLERLLARPLPDGVTLEFEVTEHQSVADFAVFAAALERLRRRGHAVALDDFGAGYSTLAYLTRFPFDKIKLDRTLVLALSRPDGAAFMAATVRMCRVSGATVLVEGVETEAELDVVKGCGADTVQGYLTGRPQPLPVLLERLQGA